MTKKNIFDEAEDLPVAKVDTKKKLTKDEVYFGAALDCIAACKLISENFIVLEKTLRQTFDDNLLDVFAQKALDLKHQPENFRGIGDASSASCELRKRATTSPLKPEEVELLHSLGISTEKRVIAAEVPELLAINPEIMKLKDPKLLQEISDKLTSIPALAGMKILTKQKAQPAVTTDVTTARSLEEACAALPNKDQMLKILKILGVLGVKPVMNENSIKAAYAVLDKHGLLDSDDL